MTGTELATRDPDGCKEPGWIDARTVPTRRGCMRIEEHPSWETLAQLRMTIRAGVLLNRFRVRDLLAMKEGQVFESLSPATEDVPVRSVRCSWDGASSRCWNTNGTAVDAARLN